MPKYVIVGGSAGGIGAIEAIREIDPVEGITVVSEEPFPQYSRPMIGDFLSGEVMIEKMKYRGDHFWEKNRVQSLTGRKVVGLNLIKKYIKLDGEEKIDFEKLLLATGGKPFTPKIEGIEKNGVFTFTMLSDAERIATKIRSKRKAVVIGGGFIGVSVTEALTKQGVNVIIVELKNRILNLILDEVASRIIEKRIRKAGVTIVTNQTVKRILGRHDNENVVGGVVLTNGQEIPCDLVIFAIGVVPRTELVTRTKMKVNQGIVVDRFMRTSVPDVYACGDVAEAYDFILNENCLLPFWPVAYEGGRVAGYNMAGKKTEYSGGTTMSALECFDIPIIFIGITTPKEDDGYETLVNYGPKSNLYKKIVLKNSSVVGMTFVGDIEKAGIIFNLMKNSVDVESFKQKLLSEDFGLVSLPENLRERLLLGN